MSEYLVELGGGRQLRFETLLAFRAAIRTGDINADARIFHRATSTWVSITKHPEYRKIQAEHPPPLLQPAEVPDPEPGVTSAMKSPGVLRLVRQVSAAFALIKQRLQPRRPHREGQPREGPRASGAQPGTPPPPSEAPGTDAQRDRWTFYS